MPDPVPMIGAASHDGKLIVVPISLKAYDVRRLSQDDVQTVAAICQRACTEAQELLAEPVLSLEELALRLDKGLDAVRRAANNRRFPQILRSGIRWANELHVKAYFETAKVGNPGTPRKKT